MINYGAGGPHVNGEVLRNEEAEPLRKGRPPAFCRNHGNAQPAKVPLENGNQVKKQAFRTSQNLKKELIMTNYDR